MTDLRFPYIGDNKEIKLNENVIFDENVDVIMSTSSIQNVQSIIENTLYIYIHSNIH